jgi:hypothetical protein
MALKRDTYTILLKLYSDTSTSKRAWGFVSKLYWWHGVEQPLVQILVVVANIQMKTLKAEVEKGSMWTVFEHGLVDPKR